MILRSFCVIIDDFEEAMDGVDEGVFVFGFLHLTVESTVCSTVVLLFPVSLMANVRVVGGRVHI